MTGSVSSEWFDRETAEKLSLRDKLFKNFKSSCLNIDWEMSEETRNDSQGLIKFKKEKYFEEKLTENIVKTKKTLGGIKIARIT